MNSDSKNLNPHKLVDDQCVHCFTRSYQRIFKKFNIKGDQQTDFIGYFDEVMSQKDKLTSPEIQQLLKSKLCRLISIIDPYEEEKKHSNELALSLYPKWKAKVLESPEPFEMALRLSLAGNVMDYGAHESFDINKSITEVLSSPLAINDAALLKERVSKAHKILYLGDNTGEIVFDKLFIETMMHNNILFAVRGGVALNDATMEDALAVGMDKVADVISNGFDAPSTVLHKSSDAFLDEYKSADLIISKGQGNFEGLMNVKDHRIFFLLMAKCNVIANVLGVKKGSFVVYNQAQ
ncbi:MAG: DUF89 family protein [Bacteroidales bacterium]|nr:DUF89 family protein [Bacteroidales bacterium]